MKILLNNTSENIKEVLKKENIFFREENNIYKLVQLIEGDKFNFLITEVSGFDEHIFSIIEKIKIPTVIETNIKTADSLKQKAEESGALAFINSDSGRYEILSLLNLLEYKFRRESEFQLENSVIDMISSPIFFKDTNLRFIACNSAMTSFLGLSKEKVIGSKSNIYFNKNRTTIAEHMDRIVMERKEKMEYETIINHSDKTERNVIISKGPLYDRSNQVIGIIGTIIDITERKKREQELEKAKEAAIQADNLKTSFLSNMSHEIRTPMNAIVGFSQLLSTPHLNDEKKMIYIEQVNYNADQLLKLIDDIIEVSRLEAGKIQINKEHTYINRMLVDLKSSFEAHKARLGKNHIDLVVRPEIEDKTFSIFTDPFRVTQIFTNLIANALKFTEQGYVEFGYTTKKIGNDDFIEFYVKDTGLGIKGEKLTYIFDRFSKIPASKTKLYGGTGLGLSISKGLTEMLGGIISVDSEENRGTIFRFTLPCEKIENIISVNKVERTNEEETMLFNWTGKSILIAEDEEMNYLYIREILRNTNAEIIWKKNGQEAVDEVENNKNIDIVLMDMKMPVMDGYEATRKIKDINPKMPVLAQTAYAMADEKEKGYNAGCDRYVEKPIKKDFLLKTIAEFIN